MVGGTTPKKPKPSALEKILVSTSNGISLLTLLSLILLYSFWHLEQIGTAQGEKLLDKYNSGEYSESVINVYLIGKKENLFYIDCNKKGRRD